MTFELPVSTFYSEKLFKKGDAVKYRTDVLIYRKLERLRGIVVGHNGEGVDIYWSVRNEVQTECPDFIEKVEQ
jgi:hypothetical protein